MRLNNKVSIITGAASGIGKESVLKFLDEGSKVVAADLNTEALNNLKNEIDHSDEVFEIFECDVSSEEAIKDLVGFAIQKYNEAQGYGIVRELVGHGLGNSLHEGPEMPNYGKRGRGKVFKEGLVVAIEPMINMGTHRVIQGRDGWTIKTADGKPSAHFEHNIAIVSGQPKLLSTFQYIYDALGIETEEEVPFK